jgi:hypothetical protein
MLTELHDHLYSTVLASDLQRDGMGLELQQDGRVVAEVFHSDVSGEFTISLFVENIPLSIIEQLISEAHIRLVPVQENQG